MLKHINRFILFSLFIGAVTGCATVSTVASSDKLFAHDQHFPHYSKFELESPKAIFELNAAAIEFVEKVTAGQKLKKDKLKSLIAAIFDRSKLSLNYAAEANTTATQTFEKGAANCLSLTIMAFSMAEHLGFEATFTEVSIPEIWTRREGNTLINGHINLYVQPKAPSRYSMLRKRPYIVDFDPMPNKHRFDTRELTRNQIVSYFYVNKAADAMINHANHLAYAYLKSAIKLDKTNAGAYLNLGVLYSRNDFTQAAELAYKKSLSENPNYASALENLALLYKKTNREFMATQIMDKLRNSRENNPYYHFSLANLALEKGKYENAVKLYKKSIYLNDKPHEFHFNLAKAYFALGDIENTRRYLNKAKKRVKNAKIEEQYAFKLSLLAGS